MKVAQRRRRGSATTGEQPAPLVFADVRRLGDAYPALDHVRLVVPRGQITALIGPDGGGARTLLELAATRLLPTSGLVRIAGHDTRVETARARAALGWVPEQPVDVSGLRVAEAIEFAARCHGVRLRRGHFVKDLLHELDLDGTADTPADDLSAAQTARLTMACALAHSPRLLVLAAPFVGVSERGREAVAKRLRAVADRGAAVLVAAAEEDDLIGLVDHVVVVESGRVTAAHDLRGQQRTSRWRLLTEDGAALLEQLRRLGVDFESVEVPAEPTPELPAAADGPAAPSGAEDAAWAAAEAAAWAQLAPEGVAPTAASGPSPAAAAIGGLPVSEPPEPAVVDVAIAQERDAAALLRALVAAGVPVHGLLPPTATATRTPLTNLHGTDRAMRPAFDRPAETPTNRDDVDTERAGQTADTHAIQAHTTIALGAELVETSADQAEAEVKAELADTTIALDARAETEHASYIAQAPNALAEPDQQPDEARETGTDQTDITPAPDAGAELADITTALDAGAAQAEAVRALTAWLQAHGIGGDAEPELPEMTDPLAAQPPGLEVETERASAASTGRPS